MGNYNAYAPTILGEEWVPIRDEQLIYSPGVNSVELGTTYVQAATRQVRDARFYVNQLPGAFASGQCGLVNIYPAGLEDQTGPIQQVIIPVSSVSTTGANIVLAGGSSALEVVSFPSDGKFLEFDYNSGTPQRVQFHFAVNAYPVLANKRILNVSLLYSGYVMDQDPATGSAIDFINPIPATVLTQIRQRNDGGTGMTFTSPGSGFLSNTGTLSELATTVNNPSHSAVGVATISDVDLGDVNNFWDPTLSPSLFTSQARMPWRYVDLQRFELSAANRQHIFLQVQVPATAATAAGFTTVPTVFIDYIALRVIYCEEKRVAYGGKLFTYAHGMNSIVMRDLLFNPDPILPAGTYLPTLSWVSPGTINFGVATNGQFPELNALRELYTIPSHVPTRVNVPFPLEDRLGDTFTSETMHFQIPQLSLHASGGTLTEPHVYGRQGAAQVYGAITATQDIASAGFTVPYPQVRWYARRFGDTTIPLTLTGVGGLSGSTASITVAEFDALTEIVDGWKEITLRFASPPSMGSGAWTWSAAAETSGNRWEVLAASAPAISGIPGSLYTLVPAPNQLGVATYQPPAGDTVELTWMPQGVASPWVTGATIDAATDAVLIFSQDPPTISGVTLTQLTQTVTGIGLNCSQLDCCIPSGIGYQRVTWTATAMPSTGFGAYELQRWDVTPGAEFETIMLASSPLVTGFNDFEARVGLNSVYRIRALNVYNFAGAWSTHVTGAPPSPGITGGCPDMTGALIFTSNAAQSGIYNAAYIPQWDGPPVEDFQLVEAEQVQFQPMYGRNGSVAFHTSERGLERFSRQLLIQAGAIDPIRLADVKTLRDLAWADLPYVCVRDDIGDRWFANVRVPNVNARDNRRKYMAQIAVTEVTDCPYPVDPS